MFSTVYGMNGTSTTIGLSDFLTCLSFSISRSMLVHNKCKQNKGLLKDKKCDSELFKTVLKFSEITMLHGNLGDSNITAKSYAKCRIYYSMDFMLGLIVMQAVLH